GRGRGRPGGAPDLPADCRENAYPGPRLVADGTVMVPAEVLVWVPVSGPTWSPAWGPHAGATSGVHGSQPGLRLGRAGQHRRGAWAFWGSGRPSGPEHRFARPSSGRQGSAGPCPRTRRPDCPFAARRLRRSTRTYALSPRNHAAWLLLNHGQNGRLKACADPGGSAAPFPTFVIHLSNLFTRTSEPKGHRQLYDSSAAFRFVVPDKVCPRWGRNLQ